VLNKKGWVVSVHHEGAATQLVVRGRKGGPGPGGRVRHVTITTSLRLFRCMYKRACNIITHIPAIPVLYGDGR
jgi:hypothetical protein